MAFKNTTNQLQLLEERHRETLQVNKAILTSISEYFEKSLAHQDRLGTEKGILRFPRDNEDVWRMLLYWRIKGSISHPRPKDSDSVIELDAKMMHLVYCWYLGDKYLIPQFQDLAMLELLALLRECPVTCDAVKIAFENTPNQSLLLKLMAKEAFGKYKKDGQDTGSLEVFDGVPGFITEFMNVVKKVDDDPDYLDDLWSECFDDDDEEGWRELMVGEGPEKHWVFEDDW